MEGGVMTETPAINLTEGPLPEVIPLWIYVFDGIKMTGVIVGVFANLITLMALSLNGDGFSHIIKMLFKYQSLLDFLCCLQAALLFMLPQMWQTGYVIFDQIICQLWHSQFTFWLTISTSIWNLVVLALERYLCVCHPLKYQAMRQRQFQLLMLAVFLCSILSVIPALFQTRSQDGQCHSKYLWDGKGIEMFFYMYAIAFFFWGYIIPCALFFVLYVLIINSFHQRSKASLGASGSSNVIDKATSQLTKTAIVVTVFAALLLGVDSWYYMLGYIGLVKYTLNSPLQKIGLFSTVMNSVVNPFIYAMFMPLYRNSVKKTFFKPCSKE